MSQTPTARARELAGVDLPDREPPIVRASVVGETVVVVSRARDPAREVHLRRCLADGIPVVTRPSGGGAVVLCPGVVVASALAAAPPDPGFPEPYFRRFCGAVAAALERLGAPAVKMRGISDLCVGDRKVAGSSLRLFRGRVLYQVSVLVEPEVEIIERYLPPPSREPDYRKGRSHREFLCTLREVGATSSVAVVRNELAAALAIEAARSGP